MESFVTKATTIVIIIGVFFFILQAPQKQVVNKSAGTQESQEFGNLFDLQDDFLDRLYKNDGINRTQSLEKESITLEKIILQEVGSTLSGSSEFLNQGISGQTENKQSGVFEKTQSGQFEGSQISAE